MAHAKTHEYRTNVKWSGATNGELHSDGLPSLSFSAPVEFGGPGGQWTPEHMMVAAAESCTLLTFFAYARRRGVKVVSYESSAKATLGRDEDGLTRFTQLVVRPVVRVEDAESATAARELLEGIAEKCFIGASLRHEPLVEATVEVVPSATTSAAG
jgi:organic hydroperoxide reductase OsmC/OhrA